MVELVKELLGLGLEAKDLGFVQICLRAVIVFTVTLVMVRCGNKRFLAQMSAFDTVLGFLLASMLARAINGTAAFFPTLAAGFLLVALHRLLAALAFHSHKFGVLVKGKADTLVRDGRRNHQALRANKISETDLLEEARLHGRVEAVEKIHTATIERNGDISVIPKNES